MPSNGAGLYFLYMNFFGDNDEVVHFNIRVNGNTICTGLADQDNAEAAENGVASCAAVAVLEEGNFMYLFVCAIALFPLKWFHERSPFIRINHVTFF